ncbi:MAG: hypothetical protein M3Y34_09045 [Actinomycetota bacterium]|nr:hypothetical protein [Actinomycetota bacterium]
MLLISVACSSCPEELEVEVETLEDVELLFCECDCGWVVLGVSELENV